jgi:tRNA 2-thiocytidine biosynthesis protein TtcA
MKESKLFLRLHRKFEQAVIDYNLIQPNDYILVCLSGGKDSEMLLKLLKRKKIKITNDFKIKAIFINQKKVKEELENVTKLCEELNVDLKIINKPIPKEKSCYECSRSRRLTILQYAQKIGANKVALGHHQDDLIETFFLNIVFSHRIAALNPLHSFFKGTIFLIRPLIYISEKEIIKELGLKSKEKCPYFKNSERKYVRELLTGIYDHYPLAKKNIFRSLYTIKTDFLLKPPGRKI